MMTGTPQRQSNQDPEFGASQAPNETRQFRNFDFSCGIHEEWCQG